MKKTVQILSSLVLCGMLIFSAISPAFAKTDTDENYGMECMDDVYAAPPHKHNCTVSLESEYEYVDKTHHRTTVYAVHKCTQCSYRYKDVFSPATLEKHVMAKRQVGTVTLPNGKEEPQYKHWCTQCGYCYYVPYE